MNNIIDKKLIKTSAKEKMLSGLTKQQVYDQLVAEFQYRKAIADILRNIPTESRWRKYGIYNHIFLGFIVLLTLAMLLKPTAALIWMAWLIYVVFKRIFNQYYWSIILGATGLPLLLVIGIYQGTLNTMMLIFGIIFSCVFILPGIYLPILLAPPYKEEKEAYVNNNGENRLRVVHKFSE